MVDKPLLYVCQDPDCPNVSINGHEETEVAPEFLTDVLSRFYDFSHRPCEDHREAYMASMSTTADQTPVSLSDVRQRPLTILVADDEELLRGLFSRVLERAGYHVILAADGREAVDHYIAAQSQGTRIDGLVLDIGMPRLDGYSALRAIREHDPDAKALFISGNQDEANRPERTAFLQKPARREELLKALEDLLQFEETAK